MISGIKPKELLFRDGTSQSQRNQPELDPQSALVEERSMEDLLRFAQEFSTKIRYYDDQLKPSGNWEAFLLGDYAHYNASDPDRKKEIRERWISDLRKYTDDPERYRTDPVMLEQFSKPHVALFATFLKLLEEVKGQINQLSERHLNYFYRTILGLEEQAAVPDAVHVVFKLVEDVSGIMVPKGTLLSAGEDAEGHELHYETTDDTYINQARIDQVKQVYADVKVVDLLSIRQMNVLEPDGGMMEMMKLALGSPEPTDPLPKYKKKDVVLATLKAELDNPATAAEATAYLKDALSLTPKDFNFLYSQIGMPPETDLSEAFAILTKAYRNKQYSNRRETLRSIHQADPLEGYIKMWKHALGERKPGDQLPIYHGDLIDTNVLINLAKILHQEEHHDYSKALAYVNQDLFMSKTHFLKCLEIYGKGLEGKATTADWLLHDNNLELAWRTKYGYDPGQPGVSRYENIYVIPDIWKAKIGGKEEDGDSSRVRTFGRRPLPGFSEGIFPARLGIAFASPQLHLAEGKRQISISVRFVNDARLSLLKRLQQIEEPFECFFSGAEKWIKVKPTALQFVSESVSSVNPIPIIRLDLTLTLSEQDPAIAVTGSDAEIPQLHDTDPVCCLMWNNQGEKVAPYHFLKELIVAGIKVGISVENLTAITLQNPNGLVDVQNPFEPFGESPEPGNTLYFTHPELSGKPLQTMDFNLTWMNPPANFAAYYNNHQLLLDKIYPPNPPPGNANYKVNPPTNTSFKARLRMIYRKLSYDLRVINLFEDKDARLLHQEKVAVMDLLKASVPLFNYDQLPMIEEEDDDVQQHTRFFSLELEGLDFMHANYPLILQQAGIEASATPPVRYVISEPYEPRLKKISINYSTGFEINYLIEKNNTVGHRLLHVHPFGSRELPVTTPPETPRFLPDYTRQGELYIGFNQTQPDENLSILFQMAQGSSNPDLNLPEINWSYLVDNQWKPFPKRNFTSDATNKLINTGIIRMNLPSDMQQENKLFGDQNCWIRASVDSNSEAVADIVDLRTQAVQAVYVNHSTEAFREKRLLAPGTISQLATPNNEIQEIIQPYSSFRGKAAESPKDYYTRVSERLRHKNRAVSMWDYERLVLEHFPEIHKVKCVPGDFISETNTYGVVDLIVVPDIRGTKPFNPFQPKASVDTLMAIQRFLDQRKPVFATVRVKNPRFLQVKSRFAVRFTDNSNAGYYARILNDALRRHLSPWAYDQGIDITLGGSIYANMLVNFIAEQPYVEYVAGIKLYQSLNGNDFKDATIVNRGENKVQADHPDVVLVSVPYHEIDLVSDKGYEGDDFTGIDYWKIELDFIVSTFMRLT